MYIFIGKNDISVYAYTKDKDIAKDFYEIHQDRFRMIKVSKSDIKEGIDLPYGGNILYYTLTGNNNEKYTIPITESDANKLMTECINIYRTFSYIRSEILSDNKFGLKNKYLNVINSLTSVLKKKDYLNYLDDPIESSLKNINSFKIFKDIC